MEKIKIITDSTADLNSYLINRYKVEVLPLSVQFGKDSYRDGIDIKLHGLLMRIKEDNIFPSTSQVNPQTFYECFKRYLEEGYKIICINISSKMSGTFQSACIAKGMLETEDIVVIDSLNVTSGLGLLAIKASKLAEQGFGLMEIKEEINKAIPHVKSALAFDSLDNLVKGGRLSKTAGVIGGIFGIKPILAVENGEMVVIGKVRGSKKSIRYIMDYIETKGIKKEELSALLHVENKDILNDLRISLSAKKAEFVECEVGCVVGAHAGPGACGVFFIENY